MRVRAITSMYYSKHQYEPGEEYTMDDREESEAKILHALGKIEILDLPGKIKAKTPKYQTRAMETEQQQPAEQQQQSEQPTTNTGPMTTDTAGSLVGPGPRYRRRDVRAQR